MPYDCETFETWATRNNHSSLSLACFSVICNLKNASLSTLNCELFVLSTHVSHENLLTRLSCLLHILKPVYCFSCSVGVSYDVARGCNNLNDFEVFCNILNLFLGLFLSLVTCFKTHTHHTKNLLNVNIKYLNLVLNKVPIQWRPL